MSVKNIKQGIAMIAALALVLSIGNIAYTTQIVSQMKNTQCRYEELLDDYSQLQEEYKIQTTKPQRRYTGNPFGTELWPGQIQSENITGMHWYSYYEGALLNCTDNVLGLGGVELEGEYTTWTHVWSRDYGDGVTLSGISVNNEGTVYATDAYIAGGPDSYIKTYGGAETNIPDYDFMFGILYHRAVSVMGRYIVGSNRTFDWAYLEVWRDGVKIFSRDTGLDNANACSVMTVAISPNGKFVALANMHDVNYCDEILMLYEGS